MDKKEKRQRRKIFFGNLKQYIKASKAKRNFSEQYYDVGEDGSVRIHVSGEGGLFSPYGKVLAPEVIDYIEQTAEYIPIDRPLKIRFSNVPGEDKQRVAECYKKHFDLQFNNKCLDLKLCNFKALILLIIGAIFLAASLLIANLLPHNILISELMTVAASFSMWESVDFFMLERANIKTQKLEVAQLLLAEIEFEEKA